MTAKVFTWDWKEQPDFAAIGAEVTRASANGQVFADEYALVVSDVELSGGQAFGLYLREADGGAGTEDAARDAGGGFPMIPRAQIEAEVAADMYRLTHPVETGEPWRSAAQADWDGSR